MFQGADSEEIRQGQRISKRMLQGPVYVIDIETIAQNRALIKRMSCILVQTACLCISELSSDQTHSIFYFFWCICFVEQQVCPFRATIAAQLIRT